MSEPGTRRGVTPGRVLVWVAEATWPAAVDAARRLVAASIAGEDVDVVLLAVASPADEDVIRGAVGGLLGRRRDAARTVDRLAELSEDGARRMLRAAAARWDDSVRPAGSGRADDPERVDGAVRIELRRGRPERVVVQAIADLGADVLVLCRDGDLSRLGPRSLGPHTRFVLDHAPCEVVLVWPQRAPGVATIPPLPSAPPQKQSSAPPLPPP